MARSALPIRSQLETGGPWRAVARADERASLRGRTPAVRRASRRRTILDGACLLMLIPKAPVSILIFIKPFLSDLGVCPPGYGLADITEIAESIVPVAYSKDRWAGDATIGGAIGCNRGNVQRKRVRLAHHVAYVAPEVDGSFRIRVIAACLLCRRVPFLRVFCVITSAALRGLELR